MNQRDSMLEFLADFSHSALQLKGSPMPTKALFDSDCTQLTAGDQTIYRHAVGWLNYFARVTRYDIGFAVSRLSRKIACADIGAWKALMHLLKYLKTTVNFKINDSTRNNSNTFHFFINSDHTDDRTTDSKNQSDFIYFLNSFPIE